MTIPAGTHFGRYEIRSPIGAGGMGEVYLAHDAQLDRPVALKLLPADVTQDEDRLRRFQQEARATSALNHPNILTIYEIGEAEGTHFIATEFIDGITLRDQMARSRMKMDEVLEVSLQVASALAAAHEAGIVHRDIKPENIMIRRDGYVKVLDFGLAKLTEERANTSPYALTLAETGPGIVIGTVTYMSPEQARGLRVDERTDIFSFGVVLYEMLAGRAPFGGPTPSDVIVSILDRQPQPLAYHLPEVSPETQRIVSKALAKEREERYQSIKDMLADLRGLKRGIELATAGGMHATTDPAEALSSSPEMTLPRADARTVRVSVGERETNDTPAVETLRLDSNQPSTPEIAHVLFMDIVGFSKHRIHQQSYLQQKLNEIASNTDEFRRAQSNDQMICKSTGDGMALVFFVDPESPVRCALQISRALLSNPDVQLRMGIHSGPVLRTVDANRQKDVAGSGINIAQRVMDCGDTGHILLSKTMADVLFEIGDRDERIDDLGTTKVKHNVEVHLFNLYTDELGNSHRPSLLPQPTMLPQTSSGARRAPIDSLAVLPLANASADPGTEYLSDGITESIINTLSQLPGLKVMARATVFRYKGKEVDIEEVRRDLNVRAVMTGRVLQFGDQLIIKIELVDTADGSQLWGEQYKRLAADIFEVQEEISKEISEKLRIKLTGEEKKLLVKRYTDNTEAYRLYLKGRFCLSKMTKEALGNAIKHFQQAIDTDPDYALAYAGLADAYYGLSSNHLPPVEAMPKARAAAEKALEIDDTLAEAHASLGLVKAFYDWDWASAEDEYKRAIELNPGYASTHHWYGWYLALMGRLNEAIAEIKQASELDPLSLEINTDLGLSFLFARQYDRAIEQFEKAMEMDPNFIWAHFFMGWAYEQKGNYEGAVAEFQKARQLDDSPLILAALGHTYVMAGRRDEALRVLAEMKELAERRHVSSYHFAIIHAALGERDEAFEWLEKTYEARSEALVWLKVDPRLDTLRTDPRFIDLQRRVGLSL
ncbi:MAG: eukaryotic-like serine/threonine-protein kinase [Acidobacteriota bacterium]|jgi:serine/threonine protein kinase/TolB-like protein/Tfp pilus assembly protein PilF|nr:eukaryotic-like serine/threonine-protein kinase [Acidobacteriota bacterium]